MKTAHPDFRYPVRVRAGRCGEKDLAEQAQHLTETTDGSGLCNTG